MDTAMIDAHLENIDRRLTNLEQILPTLATRDDLTALAAREELRLAVEPLATKEELNEWERENILLAREWAIKDRTSPHAMASDEYVRKLHRKMFGETWKWAGRYRTTEKNIAGPFPETRERLMALFADVRYWMDNRTYPSD